MAEVPEWLKRPSYVPWRPPSTKTYARWTQPVDWGWYAPQAWIEDKPWAGVVNRLLPYMAPQDVKAVSRQLFTAGGTHGGPFERYLEAAPAQMSAPAPPSGGTYPETLLAIKRTLNQIPDATARDWTRSVFDVYDDLTNPTGMRTSEQEAKLQAQLSEMFDNIPEEAEPYAAALQRLIQPTVVNPAREWYEMPAYMRTSPTSWRALGYEYNPAWR